MYLSFSCIDLIWTRKKIIVKCIRNYIEALIIYDLHFLYYNFCNCNTVSVTILQKTYFWISILMFLYFTTWIMHPFCDIAKKKYRKVAWFNFFEVANYRNCNIEIQKYVFCNTVTEKILHILYYSMETVIQKM